MLSDDDLDLVRRDPDLPGLATVFDPQALTELIRRHRPHHPIYDLRPTYVRYKRGRSCIVAFELRVEHHRVDGYAKAFAHHSGSEAASSDAKLRKFVDLAQFGGPLGSGTIVERDLAAAICFLPADGEIHGPVHRLFDPRERGPLVRKLIGGGSNGFPSQHYSIRRLAYKPERRFVAQLVMDGKPRAVVRAYTGDDFPRAMRVARTVRNSQRLVVPELLGASERRRVLATNWQEGEVLADLIARDSAPAVEVAAAVAATGAAIAELHRQPQMALDDDGDDDGVPRRDAAFVDVELLAAAAAVETLCPELASRTRQIVAALRRAAATMPATTPSLIHGDCYAKQVVVPAGEGPVCLLDFDEAARGDAAVDIGNFLAHLWCNVVSNALPGRAAHAAADALLRGYRSVASTATPHGDTIRFYTALALLKLAVQPFRRREADWRRRAYRICDLAADLTSDLLPPKQAGDTGTERITPEPVDPAMPYLESALDSRIAARFLVDLLEIPAAQLDLHGTRIVRHKPAQRALIEYDVRHDGHAFTVIGKVSAKGLDPRATEAWTMLRERGFDPHSADGISVPQPLGTVPSLRMTLYRKVNGVPATELLCGEGGVALAVRIVDAAHKLHRADLPLARAHGLAQELRILHDRLGEVAAREPRRAARIQSILARCDDLAASIRPLPPATIHRDFYPDQIIVDPAGRLFLIDFDLCCRGDPCLDIGNFIAHITEHALRIHGDPDALRDRELAMEQRFAELHGTSQVLPPVHAYAALSLARHIFISTRIPNRRPLTEPLMDICDGTLALLRR